ncbi:preprotein translocase subunit YajC [uncultured Abyssibacter sp.]|uniref:preprotein translocase subunit YajC n=1 Tax=uncultured Abyssibacter sp. TaxID=2320202 RepID=UPI0032B2F464
MDFLISAAHAQQGGASAPNAFVQLLPLVGLIVLFYFMLIRPQMKRNKEHKQLIASISKGDEVITAGGLTGSVADLGEEYVKLQVADDVVITVQRQSISSVLPKGSLKSL